MKNETSNNQHQESGIDLLECFNVLRKYRKKFLMIVTSVTLVAILWSYTLPVTYSTKAALLPIGGVNPGAIAVAQADIKIALGAAMGTANTAGKKLLAILKSRTLAEQVIQKHALISYYFGTSAEKTPALLEAAVSQLVNKNVEFAEDVKLGTIVIKATFENAQLAADVANSYIEFLQQSLQENAFTNAKRNRLFIHEQLVKNKKELLESGKKLSTFYQSGGVSSVAGSVDVPLDSVDGTPSMLLTQIEMLQEEKDNIQQKIEVIKDIPQQVYLEYLVLQKELLAKMNAFFNQQFEMAKIDEAKEDLAFQVIDNGNVSFSRSGPNRKLIIVLSFAASIFIGVFTIFFQDYIIRMKETAISRK